MPPDPPASAAPAPPAPSRTGIEDIYPLSPLQRGLLFHALSDGADDVYLVQRSFVLDGEVDEARLRAAWERVVERHSALRTAFAWEGVDEPLQVVHDRAKLPWATDDWSDLPEAEQDERLAALLRADRETGFDLERPPLMRLTLVRLGRSRHRLLWTSHHLVFDGWSAAQVLAEARALYDGRDLPPARPYRDYVAWLAEQDGEASERYWREALVGLETPTQLGLERAGASGSGELVHALPPELGAALEALARRERLTPSTLYLGAWLLLLARYGGTDDVVTGIAVSGRFAPLPGIESMVGVFVNTLPLRAHVEPAAPTLDWLRALQGETIKLRQHEHASLAELRRLTDLPQGEQLFETLFTFQNYPKPAEEPGSEGGFTLRSDGGGELPAYPLTVDAVPGGRPSIRLAYDRARFADEAMERLATHLETLLASIVRGPGSRLGELELLPPAERRLLLEEWSGADDEVPEQTALELVEAQADAHPEATAVVAGGVRLSYAELDRRANRLARRLAALGVGAETVVGLRLPRGLDLVVCELAVWKAGGAFLPLDPDSPPDRLAFQLDDVGARLVLAPEWLAEQAEAIGREPAERLPARAALGNLAYVVFTSGSTGLPKGVAVEQRALAGFVHGWAALYGSEPPRSWLSVASPAFDVSCGDLLRTLPFGATLVLADAEQAAVPELLADLAARERVEACELVPGSLVAALALELEERGQTLPDLRLVVEGTGAWQKPESRRLLRRLSPDARLGHVFGLTEAAIDSLFFSCPASEVDPKAPLPVGVPRAGVRVYVLDAELRPVPVGVAGELFVGGVGLARGYVGRPGATAERFVPDPYGEPGSRLHRTGDLVRLSPSGEVQFVGRLDEQVKVRGVRVEPGEVAARLGGHPGVAEAAVVGGDGGLVAYVVPADGPPPSPEDLRRFLRGFLPDAMVPARFVALDALPRTVSGKLDRRALPEPQHLPGPAFRAPRTPAEELVCGIWAEVLRVEQVGVDDNFFALGGDSILAIQVVARARGGGLELAPKQLFEHQTPATLALAARPVAAERRPEPEPAPGPIPLTPVQAWFFAQELPRDRFGQTALLRVPDELGPERVEELLALLAARHDALRLRFRRDGSGWTQELLAAGPRPRCRLVHEPGIERTADALQTELSIAEGRLVAAALVALGPGERRLLLCVHHLAVDVVSLGVLVEELALAYEGSPLPERTTSFARWARSLPAQAESAETRGELPYWRAQLERPPPLPRDAHGENSAASAATVSVTLGRDDTDALLRAPAAYRARVEEVLLCAFAQALVRRFGPRLLLVELEGHGREPLGPGLDLSRTAGWFTSLYPVRLRLARPDDPGESLKHVKETLRAVPRRGVGYGLLRHLHPNSGLADLAAPEIAFNYLGRLDWRGEEELEDFGVASDVVGGGGGDGRRPYLLEVAGGVFSGELTMHLTYSTEIHERATIEALADEFSAALRGLVVHCLSPGAGGFTPSDFPLARLDQPTLDGIVDAAAARGHIVEDVYPLSPLQQGLLFHTLYEAGEDVYLAQRSLLLEGPVDPEALYRAWAAVLERHSVLRSAFVQDDEPLQVVYGGVEPTWSFEDWSGVAEHEQEERLAVLLAEDRACGFDLARAPLMRLTLVRLAPDRHRLVWTTPHLVLDGWSLPHVLEEALALHDGKRDLPPPRPYRDYIAWLAEQEPADDYWRTVLAGFEAPTRLALEPGGGTGFGELVRELPAQVSAGLEALARTERLTPNTLCQGAWLLLLGRYAGTDDVLCGVTVSGRSAPLAGIESMVGVFINTLPLRARLEPEAPAVEWLRTLQDRMSELRAHEHGSLADLQRLSDLPPGEQLFETTFVFENYPLGNMPDADGSLQVSAEVYERNHYPLTLIVVPGERLGLVFSYDRTRFSDDAVERLAAQYETLLASLVAEPHARLDELQLLPEAERAQLERWNRTAAPFPAEQTLAELFEQQATATPQAFAVVAATERLTYGELNRRANRLAHRLVAEGVGPDSLVALQLERGVELVVAVLAVWKAGGAYLALDPGYPEERLAFMRADAGPAVVVTDAWLDAEREALTAEPEHDPPARAHPDNLAYVIYTSGSTGRPKAVAMPHRPLRNLVDFHARSWPDRQSVKTLQFASPSFDVAFEEMGSAWATGGALVLIDEERRRDPALLARWIRDHDVGRIFVTPTVLEELTPHLEGDPARAPHAIPSGEQLKTTEAIERVWRRPGAPPFENTYGPSETHVILAHRLDPEAAEWPALPPLGRPIQNARVYVLDRMLRHVPIGVPGELCIGGVSVSRGYLHRPALTAERFVPDPFGEPGTRLYRSGDLARFQPDGTIDFLGRIDHQVKVRGFRVELGEIEARLLEHPAVADAVVVACDDAGGAKRLVAYVVAVDCAPAPAELRAFLAHTLPDFMVPSAFVALEALPRTPSGKLDRRSLPEPERRPELERPYVAPRTYAEQLLASVWAEVLEVERVGVDDDLFELGAHSLTATRAIGRAARAFGLELPVRLAFEHRTVGALAAAIERLRVEAVDPLAAPIVPAARDRLLPLSHAQERLWFLDRLVPENAAYTIPLALRLQGALDVAALQAALSEVVRRHESLRTRFAETADGRPFQVVEPPSPLPLPLLELEPGVDDEVERLAAEEAARPFDLGRAPLLRATLLRLADEEHVVLLTMHHVASDGWSLAILTSELGALYDAFAAGRESPLPELSIQYADYAVWQREWLEGGPLEAQLRHWRAALDELPTLELPTDRPRPRHHTYGGSVVDFTLGRELSAALQALWRREGATAYMTLLAAVQILLGRYSGQEDVPVGSPIAGRNRPELEGLIGFFVNTLVLRGDLSGDPSFRELLRRTREQALAAYANQDLPFEILVAELEPERDLSRHPLFQVVFSLENEPAGELELGGLRISNARAPIETTHFDLELHMVEGEDGLSGGFVYNSDLFDRETVERMVRHFRTLLESIVRDPDAPLPALELVPDDELRLVLDEWNASAADLPAETVTALFEREAAASPDAPALVCGEERLSYGELDRRANRLARRLRRLGVGPEVRVALVLERGVELVVSLLAVLKAGGAYVPLDPSAPPERLAFMVEDAGAALEVTPQWLRLEADAVVGEPDEPLPDHPEAESLAYVIYTSGSTGAPKGVAVAHRALTNYTLGAARALGLGPRTRAALVQPLHFDSSATSVFGTLARGGCLHVVPEELGFDGAALAEQLRRHEIDLLKITPSHLAALHAGAAPGDLLPHGCLVVGGEASDLAWLGRLAALRRCAVWNHYGPTETTVGVTVFAVGAADAAASGSAPLGRPLPNTRLYVLDAGLRPVPVGVPGELYVGGAAVARGYLGRPALTAERFLPDPFGPPGARLYRTGDRARFRADGNLQFLGRVDEQVKLRGVRLEPGEVESRLRAHPGVAEAAVVVREERLLAYLVAAGAEPPAEGDLRDFLGGFLPAPMLPSGFVVVPALPRTSSGKLDRRALPEPERTTEAAFRPPTTEAERMLCTIWADLLGVERVGLDDNFFALGGDSILAIQVVARARRHGLELAPRQLFEQQTPGALALVAGSAAGAPEPEAEPDPGPVPLVPAQARFLVEELRPDPLTQSVLLRVPDDLDAARVEELLAALAARHDALRLRFVRVGGAWRQELHPEAPRPTCALFETGALEREADALRAGLRIEEGKLLAGGLFALGAGERRLFLCVHHLAVDVVSFAVLVEELELVLRGEPLPARTSSFSGWARGLPAVADAAETLAELPYWRAQLELTPLPRDRAGENTAASAAVVSLALDPAETEALLRRAPAASRTSVEELLVCALTQAVLHRFGGEALALELEGHGREALLSELDLTRTVGWFTSHYPLRLAPEYATDPAAALAHVKEALRAVPRRGVGYGLLRYLSKDPEARRLAALPEPELRFNYVGRLDAGHDERRLLASAPEPVGSDRPSEGMRPRVLDVLAGVHGGRLEVSVTYSSNLHERATIEELAGAFGAALRALVAQCVSPGAGVLTPSDFPLARLDQAALDRIVTRVGAIEDVYPLSPLQQGLLFHSLDEPEEDVYFVERVFLLEGEVDPVELRRAWEGVLERHQALRTSFLWEGLPEPLQVVHERVELPFVFHDWSGLSDDEQDERLAALLGEDRAAGFDLARAPLLRLTLVRLGPGRHRLVWTSHHLVLDGWSSVRVVEEAFALYEGRELLPARPYREYVAWLASQGGAAAESWWREALAGVEAPTRFELEPAAEEGYGAVARALPAELTAALEALARRERLTLNTLCQGAWLVLTSRYARSEDVLCGITVSGRSAPLPGIESIVGVFVNTLPLRARVEPEARALAWLRGLQERMSELRQHEHSSLAELQRLVDLPAGEPLFDTLFAFQNYPLVTGLGGGSDTLRIASFEDEERPAYPLTVDISPGERLSIRIAYDRARFGDDAVARLAAQLETLLGSLVADPRARLGELELLPAAERRGLERANDTAGPLPGVTIVELFQAQAAARPQTTAVVDGDERVSYGELNRRANRLAHRLAALGVGPESVVALQLERSVELVVCALAVWKAGGAYLALDPDYPRERLELMRADARPALVLTRAWLERNREVLEREGEHDPAPRVRPNNLAYVVYTSGSTGRPKGVALEHRSLAGLVAGWRDVYGREAAPKLLSLSSPAFDVFTGDLARTLPFGSTLLLCPDEAAAVPERLYGLLRSERIEAVELVPGSLLTDLVEYGRELPHLRLVLNGTGVWEDERARRVGVLLGPGAKLGNVYGVAEAAVDSTLFTTPAKPPPRTALPIGRPLANARAYVVDRALRLAPLGAAGELCIGGVGLARGYLGRPALTAERFLPDPWGEPGSRMYRTGDLVRRRADGDLEFLGRLDEQVKVRGVRVEPGEIEARLREHPAVAEAAVVAHAAGPGESRLTGWIVAAAEAPTADELRRFLRARLPDTMVPSAFEPLDALPLTPNGKLDRKALRELRRAEARAGPRVAARTPVEAAVAAVWAEVLGIEEIGVEDDFFDLGGHSLTATRVVAQLRATLAAGLPLRAIFRAPTVAALAAEIERLAAHADGGAGRCEPALVRSEILGDERYVYVYRSPGVADAGPYPLLVALDGVEYVEELGAPRILDELVEERRLPPLVALFVDSVSVERRERDLNRNRDFVSFLTDELVPWARSRLHAAADPARTAIAGSSDGARAAAFAGLARPDVFGNVLALSGALEGFEEDVEGFEGALPRFYLYTGLLDPEEIVSSTRRIRDGLRERDVPLEYRERPAAHTYEAWREPFADGLETLLGRAARRVQ